MSWQGGAAAANSLILHFIVVISLSWLPSAFLMLLPEAKSCQDVCILSILCVLPHSRSHVCTQRTSDSVAGGAGSWKLWENNVGGF